MSAGESNKAPEGFEVGDFIGLTPSTGFGTIEGELCAIKQHWIVIGHETKGEMWVQADHIVAMWKLEEGS